jgi:hypothetical protein
MRPQVALFRARRIWAGAYNVCFAGAGRERWDVQGLCDIAQGRSIPRAQAMMLVFVTRFFRTDEAAGTFFAFAQIATEKPVTARRMKSTTSLERSAVQGDVHGSPSRTDHGRGRKRLS